MSKFKRVWQSDNKNWEIASNGKHLYVTDTYIVDYVTIYNDGTVKMDGKFNLPKYVKKALDKAIQDIIRRREILDDVLIELGKEHAKLHRNVKELKEAGDEKLASVLMSEMLGMYNAILKVREMKNE